MVYKSLNGLSPDYLSCKFIPRNDINNSYDMRNSAFKLAAPLTRTNYYKNSFSYSGTVLWNSLPSNVRQAASLTSFRKLLRHSDMAFMYKQPLFIYLILSMVCIVILGDPGADSGGEGKSKQVEKYSTKKSKER